MPHSGKLEFFVNSADTAYGFILPDAGGGKIHAHKDNFQGDISDIIITGGQKVTYVLDPKKKMVRMATSWRLKDDNASSDGGGDEDDCLKGTIKSFLSDKGFGFIKPDDGSEDLFAHVKQFKGGDSEDFDKGDRVGFESEMDKKTDKRKAASWWRLDGNDSRKGASRGQNRGRSRGRDNRRDSRGRSRSRGRTPPHPGHGAPYPPHPGYGVPPGYAPHPGYGAPPGYPPHPAGYQPSPYGAPPGADPRYAPYGAPAPGPHPGYGAPAPQYGAPAPQDWETMTDPASGKPYYCNRATGQTSWTPPPANGAAPPAREAPASSAEWEPAGTDPASGRPYYRSRSTGQTSWTIPESEGPPRPTAAPALPAGWEQFSDPASGRPYYRNSASGQTSWELPR